MDSIEPNQVAGSSLKNSGSLTEPEQDDGIAVATAGGGGTWVNVSSGSAATEAFFGGMFNGRGHQFIASWAPTNSMFFH